jgi:cytochrome P450
MASKTEVTVNLFDPAVQQCPYDAYKTLRDEAPAYNIPGTEIWVVTRYEDVRRVLTDADAFPSTSKNTAFRAGDGTLERAAKVAITSRCGRCSTRLSSPAGSRRSTQRSNRWPMT